MGRQERKRERRNNFVANKEASKHWLKKRIAKRQKIAEDNLAHWKELQDAKGKN
jgi:hypothetical protein